MKNKLLYLLFSLFTLSASAADINAGTRANIAEALTRIVDREVAGTKVKIQSVKVAKKRVRIYTTIGLSYYPFRPDNVQAMRDSVRRYLPSNLRKFGVELYSDNREIADLVPMAYRSEAIRNKMIPFTNPSGRQLVTRLSAQQTPTQGLVGRHIALWQSHGRFFDQTRNRWKWQRSQLWQTCEDLYTQSYVLPYLVPMLERAGACVLLPRERDVQKIEVLADNDNAAQYREQGSWQSGGRGFAHLREVYHTGENPFHEGTTRRTTTVAEATPTATATWSAAIPPKGEYALYVSYEATSNSTDDARYTVHHLGGETQFSVNQTMGGGTWIYLGTFLFERGNQPLVELTNASQQAGRIVSADAIKIGGGYGNIARSVNPKLRKSGDEVYLDETSGYPRFCEGARYWLQWAGFDEKVYTPKENLDDYKDDYMSRANWVNALMGGSQRLPDSTGLRIPIDMAMAFHSDAGVRDGDETVGTLGIFYTKDNKGKFVGGADRYRSRDLTDLVMTQIVSDIRASYEPTWNRRGLWNRSYYEARVPSVPTMLLELLSHQNFADMRYGNDPRFKFLVSRAVYKGILRFVSSQYGVPYVVQPLPVADFRIGFERNDAVRLEWAPVVDPLEKSATATGYIVYTRIGSGAFDNGRYTADPYFVATQDFGKVYSYKITAVNAGGESSDSEILAACCTEQPTHNVLVVNGFDRVSAPPSIRCDTLAGFTTEQDFGVADRRDISFIGAQRIFDLAQARIEDDNRALGACFNEYETDVIGGNTFDYPALHGRSIAKAGYAFCSASASAVEQGVVRLTDYAAVDLILGKQASTTLGADTLQVAFRTFSQALQQQLRSYKQQGGNLLVSGCYITSDLKSDADLQFAAEVLAVTPDGTHPTHKARIRTIASKGGFSRSELRLENQFTPANYRIEQVDALRPIDDAGFVVMRYVDNRKAAVVASSGAARSVVMGFPFEALNDEVQRDQLMKDVLKFLLK